MARPDRQTVRIALLTLVLAAIGFLSMPLMGQTSPGGETPAAPAPPAAQAPPPSVPAPIDAGDGSVIGLDTTTGELPTLLELFQTNLIINGILAALSILALLLFIYFLLTISTAAMAPSSFVDDVNKLILQGKYEEAVSVCRSHRRTFAANVIQRCLENAGKGHSVILDMLDTEGRRRADVMWNRISYLADVSNVAPMLGLLGTVIGMIQAFFTLPTQQGNISSGILSNGVAQAMATTMFGLAVAILATVFYSIIKSRATRALADVEQITHSIVDHIKRGEA